MAIIDVSKGRYWDEGITLVSSCTRVSIGCENCWALAMDHRFGRSGSVEPHRERLGRFKKTTKPTVFSIWNDLFHSAVSDDFIKCVFNSFTFEIHPPYRHTYLILTKRPQRMLDFCSKYGVGGGTWPVYFGLTVCNQKEADVKIPIFLQVPGKKFLSIEPMLGAIDFKKVPGFNKVNTNLYNWNVILGGETGHGARPLHPDWVRKVRDDCAAAGVDFFFKSWGEWGSTNITEIPQDSPDFGEWTTISSSDRKSVGKKSYYACNGEIVQAGALMGWKKAYHMEKIGRKKAGRELDGRTHDDLPWVQA